MPYRTVPAIGQLHDNSCWAACLAWFLKAQPGGRPSWTQARAIQEYERATDSDTGALRDEAVLKGWRSDTRLKMATMLFETPDPELADLPLGTRPVCIAFRHLTGFAHMNVIWRAEDTGYIQCMEPFWPFPGTDGKRTGRFVKRTFEHFNFGDRVVLAWARPANGGTSQMPSDVG